MLGLSRDFELIEQKILEEYPHFKRLIGEEKSIKRLSEVFEITTHVCVGYLYKAGLVDSWSFNLDKD